MQNLRNILVGVDLSASDRLASAELNEATQEAVDHAIWLAKKVHAEVAFFSALELSAKVQEILADEQNSFSQTVETEANAALDRLVDVAKQQNVAASRVLTVGPAWLEIIRQVLRNRHDLVIVGTRGLRLAGRILLGSTGMKLLRKCPCPVWITKPGLRLREETREINVLVASDLSETSDHALELAINGGQLADMKIHLLHVYDDFLDNRIILAGISEDKARALRKQSHEEAEQALHGQLSKTDYRTLKYGVQAHVACGEVDAEILRMIDEHDIDLLVMGTAARQGFPGMLLGNTAERLLPQVTCSVLAVKPPGFVSPVTLD